MSLCRLAVIAALLAGVASSSASAQANERRPNVLIIITDDQGHGDLGIHGNPVIKTPNLDRLARDGVRLTNFYVSPVCAPTRASLMTGRYNYRTGVTDTFLGRAMMHTDEATLAERLAAAGYRTGIFGKWHLGDCAPMRPMDQGFRESLVLRGGGIGQPSDPPGGTHYFDPMLQHNGQPEKRTGYCSDIFTNAAIDFIASRENRPFFAYLAFNCPHTPLEVPERDLQKYRGADLSPDRFPKTGRPLPGPAPQDVTEKVYAMVTNIDDNLGRLFRRLDELGVADDTLVIFLTDNGPQQVRYNSGLRGLKGSVYDGGIRVPCFWRWPGRLKPGSTIDRIAAHIDVTPTVLEACGVPKTDDVKLDGVSLWLLLTGKVAAADWPDRTLFFQWHRGDAPERFRALAARSQQYKLVRAEGPPGPPGPPFELFAMSTDPFEQYDLAAERTALVKKLKAAYSAWFDDVSRTRGYNAPRIYLGSDLENPTTLTRQDWRGVRAEVNQNWRGPVVGEQGEAFAYWEVDVKRPGDYRVTVFLKPDHPAGTVRFSLGRIGADKAVKAGQTSCDLRTARWDAGPNRLEAWLDLGASTVGIWMVEVSRLR